MSIWSTSTTFITSSAASTLGLSSDRPTTLMENRPSVEKLDFFWLDSHPRQLRLNPRSGRSSFVIASRTWATKLSGFCAWCLPHTTCHTDMEKQRWCDQRLLLVPIIACHLQQQYPCPYPALPPVQYESGFGDWYWARRIRWVISHHMRNVTPHIGTGIKCERVYVFKTASLIKRRAEAT